MLPIDIKIIRIEIVSGRAEIEVALPECFADEEKGMFELYLWEAGALSVKQNVNMQLSGPAVSVQPIFYCTYPAGEDDKCVMKIVQPHLWEGIEKPYLYHLEIYWMPDIRTESQEDLRRTRELVCDRFIAIRSILRIEGKGYFLNGQPFVPRCISYGGIRNISSGGEQLFWEGIMQKLRILVQMGANTLMLDTGDGMTEEERIILQKYCDRVGLLLYVRGIEPGKGFGSAAVFVEYEEGEYNTENDNCVAGTALFESPGLPTDVYYRCRSLWSKEPFVYISAKSLHRQADGRYALRVYTSCKKVTLMINDKIFGVHEASGELLFQDISIKGFPVDIIARTEDYSMTIRCYGV